MENRNTHSAYVRELLTSLSDDKIPLIDFDRLKSWLAETSAILEGAQRMQQESDVLRQDYLGRIGGMVKAIAAANRHPDAWATALTYLESLPSLSASDLVEHYRKTAARFRDAFPTSFGPALDRTRGSRNLKDVSRCK
ncbi:MAG TPA: hypothetical protein VN285_00650 [Candidatus Deferrimicrobium sp.]|nr:hypothetical protein [Candidatus Deferrimicrobium sp.]